jgi:acyl carrier protein
MAAVLAMKREQPTRVQAATWLSGFLQQHFELAPERIRADADIYRDLDLDSIDAADIVLKFNETFGRSVDIRAFREVRTIAQALDVLDA